MERPDNVKKHINELAHVTPNEFQRGLLALVRVHLNRNLDAEYVAFSTIMDKPSFNQMYKSMMINGPRGSGHTMFIKYLAQEYPKLKIGVLMRNIQEPVSYFKDCSNIHVYKDVMLARGASFDLMIVQVDGDYKFLSDNIRAFYSLDAQRFLELG